MRINPGTHFNETRPSKPPCTWLPVNLNTNAHEWAWGLNATTTHVTAFHEVVASFNKKIYLQNRQEHGHDNAA